MTRQHTDVDDPLPDDRWQDLLATRATDRTRSRRRTPTADGPTGCSASAAPSSSSPPTTPPAAPSASGDEPMAMADRRGLLRRLMVALDRPGVDGRPRVAGHRRGAAPARRARRQGRHRVDEPRRSRRRDAGPWTTASPATTPQASSAPGSRAARCCCASTTTTRAPRPPSRPARGPSPQLADRGLVAMVEPLPYHRDAAGALCSCADAASLARAVTVASALGHHERLDLAQAAGPATIPRRSSRPRPCRASCSGASRALTRPRTSRAGPGRCASRPSAVSSSAVPCSTRPAATSPPPSTPRRRPCAPPTAIRSVRHDGHDLARAARGTSVAEPGQSRRPASRGPRRPHCRGRRVDVRRPSRSAPAARACPRRSAPGTARCSCCPCRARSVSRSPRGRHRPRPRRRRGPLRAGRTAVGLHRAPRTSPTPAATAARPGQREWCGGRAPQRPLRAAGFQPRYGRADDVPVEVRGAGQSTRLVRNFGVPGVWDHAEKLVCCELVTPPGNWSSHPPHKHDVTPPCRVVNEEIYYYRIAGPDQVTPAPKGFGLHRTYTGPEHAEAGLAPLDETYEVRDGDVVLVPLRLPRPVRRRARLPDVLPQRPRRAGRRAVDGLLRRPGPRLDPGQLGRAGRRPARAGADPALNRRAVRELTRRTA